MPNTAYSDQWSEKGCPIYAFSYFTKPICARLKAFIDESGTFDNS